MPIFTPGRRWQPAFLPFKRETAGNRALAFVERITKGPLFGCRMCGNCLLQETAFICPMECPKGARNGPCGGSTEASCYVDPTRPCIWYAIYDRAFRLGREELLLEVMPPLDWDKVGGETWGDVVQQVRTVGAKRWLPGCSPVINKSGRSRPRLCFALFVSRIGGVAMRRTMRRLTTRRCLTWSAASVPVNLW
ncbi:MAG: methylenetetrahydrofolate reductase C-terminal domain-containing protein [Chloroflexi bacterium]|nr:methylenetetrahydrofolate reductase C-terminal domain-containing protein [Chloroflexota bacterium]